jgi:drug/metabolite transporter (DMT)-like permease
MELPEAGAMAALGTAFCWTASSLFFEASGKRIGSLSVNIIRLFMAFTFFSITLMISRGSPIPFDFPQHAWIWLSISGLVGLMIGDMMLFQAFVEVGPRVSMLVMSLVPVMASLMGWALPQLAETYDVQQCLGMAITLSGVVLVVLEKPGKSGKDGRYKTRKITTRGVLLAFGGAVGQALGLVTGKIGIGEHLDPFAATQIRVVTALLGFSILFVFIGAWGKVWRSLNNIPAMLLTAGGATVGPYLGVALMMLALRSTSSGVTATIIALVPVMLVPAAVVIDKERVSLRALVGTLVAFAGVVLLMGKF